MNPSRKRTRLKDYDDSAPGLYFLTVCTKEKQNRLGNIVGCGIYDAPKCILSQTGQVVEMQLLRLRQRYEETILEQYVIMPNHLHLLLRIPHQGSNGSSQAPNPTNAVIPKYISLLKRLCTRAIGENIWQMSYYDHIVRDERDEYRIRTYMENNPAKWLEDTYYAE